MALVPNKRRSTYLGAVFGIRTQKAAGTEQHFDSEKKTDCHDRRETHTARACTI